MCPRLRAPALPGYRIIYLKVVMSHLWHSWLCASVTQVCKWPSHFPVLSPVILWAPCLLCAKTKNYFSVAAFYWVWLPGCRYKQWGVESVPARPLPGWEENWSFDSQKCTLCNLKQWSWKELRRLNSLLVGTYLASRVEILNETVEKSYQVLTRCTL